MDFAQAFYEIRILFQILHRWMHNSWIDLGTLDGCMGEVDFFDFALYLKQSQKNNFSFVPEAEVL